MLRIGFVNPGVLPLSHVVFSEEHGSSLGWRKAVAIDVPVANHRKTHRKWEIHIGKPWEMEILWCFFMGFDGNSIGNIYRKWENHRKTMGKW